METFRVRDIGLADQGKLNIEYAERQMGALLNVRERFAREKPFVGLTIGMALHVTKETAVLVRTLRAGGATVAIAGCNPLSTQDDVAAALADEGVAVFAHKGQTTEEYYQNLDSVVQILKSKVESQKSKENVNGQMSNVKCLITIDDGCDLVTMIHKEYPELIPHIIGGCEETTTGIVRLKAMERDGALKCPMIAVNDNKTKHLMDNYYGTGQSTLDGILRATNVLFAGKTLVVAGYGSCGKGVALRAKGFGSNVIVTEVDAFCALQAMMDGFRVMPMEEAAPLGDVFVTVTGNKHVLRKEHFEKMKSGALLANSGHFDLEIDLKALKAMSKEVKRVRPMLEEYVVSGDSRDTISGITEIVSPKSFLKSLFVLGEGRLVNLAAAEGHPSEVMSLSFCGQALACEWLVQQAAGEVGPLPQAQHEVRPRGAADLEPRVYTLPSEIDDTISSLQLTAMGVQYDRMTEEQKKYISSWEEGT